MHFPIRSLINTCHRKQENFLSNFSNFIFSHLRKTYGSVLNRLSRSGRPIKTACSHDSEYIFRVSSRTLLRTSSFSNAKNRYCPILFTCIIIHYDQHETYQKNISIFTQRNKPSQFSCRTIFFLKKKKQSAFLLLLLFVILILKWFSKIIRYTQISPALAILIFSNLLSFFASPTILPSLLTLPDFSITCNCLYSVPVILATQILNIDPQARTTIEIRQIKQKQKTNETKPKSTGWRSGPEDVVERGANLGMIQEPSSWFWDTGSILTSLMGFHVPLELMQGQITDYRSLYSFCIISCISLIPEKQMGQDCFIVFLTDCIKFFVNNSK